MLELHHTLIVVSTSKNVGGMLGKVDVAAAILEFTIKGESKQDLETKLNMSADALEEYLVLLKSKDLVSIQSSDKKHLGAAMVRITKRGIQFLNLYSSMNMKYLTVSK